MSALRRNGLRAEAEAFNGRIKERVEAGFVPDLRRAVKCDYFYQSFWRDPHFIDLYLGHNVRKFLGYLDRYARPGAEILDAGCGAGYIALEFARAGYRVTGIDIAEDAIEEAQRTLADNPFKETFGALRYEVSSVAEIAGTYDAIVFSGILHHLPEMEAALVHATRLLRPGGIVIAHEPCHESWRKSDAAQVAMIRAILSAAGLWYEPPVDGARPDDLDAFDQYVEKVHREYVLERDPDEAAGQSPNDNVKNGAEILATLRTNFQQLAHEPGFSFIYRMLGGVRAPDEATLYRLADLLACYDAYAVQQGFLEPNVFFFVGRKPD